MSILVQQKLNKFILEVSLKKKEVVFWSKSKINKSNFILIDTINLNIGITKKIKNKNSLIRNKEFMPGDTDSFITIN